MKRLQLAGSISLGIAMTTAALVACGGDDDNSVVLDVGNDSGTDGTIDRNSSSGDANRPDTNTSDNDSGNDSSTIDADAGDLDADTDADAGEVADADAGEIEDVFVPPPPDASVRTVVATLIAERMCNVYTRCCYGNPSVANDAGVDGGPGNGQGYFDRKKCLDTFKAVGYSGSNTDLALADESLLTFDDAKRDACFAALDALPCEATGAAAQDARNKCFAIIQGTQSVGGQCNYTIECKDSEWCNLNGDAGVPVIDAGGTPKAGVCVPIRTAGGSCGDVQVSSSRQADSVVAENACSSRGRGETGLACQSYDLVSGKYFTDRSDWKCQPRLTNGQVCNTDVSCGEGLCDQKGGYLCTQSLNPWTVAQCKDFLVK